MKGEITVVNEAINLRAFVIEKSSPECGKWNYDNGVLMRGFINKEVINLVALLSEIQHAPDYIKNGFAGMEGLNSFTGASFLAGGNTIVGLMARSSRTKKIQNSVCYWAVLKDGRKLLFSSDVDICNELLRIPGVIFKTQDQCQAEIDESLRVFKEENLRKRALKENQSK
jgi:hypothetical protein